MPTVEATGRSRLHFRGKLPLGWEKRIILWRYELCPAKTVLYCTAPYCTALHCTAKHTRTVHGSTPRPRHDDYASPGPAFSAMRFVLLACPSPCASSRFQHSMYSAKVQQPLTPIPENNKTGSSRCTFRGTRSSASAAELSWPASSRHDLS